MAIFNRCSCGTHNSSKAKICKACGSRLGKNYYIQYSYEGRRKIEKIGDSIGFAREVLAKRKSDIREGKFFGNTSAIHWNDFFDKYYRPYCVKNLANFQEARFNAAREFSGFQKQMNKISRTDIEEYRESLENGKRTKATINRYIQVIKFAFNYAESLDLIERNPTRKLNMYKEDLAERRVVSLQEEIKLLKACQESGSRLLYYFVLTSIYTGMRYSEVLSLKWSQVSFDMKSIRLFKTKSNDYREIPLIKKLYDALKELFDITGEYEHVFTNLETGEKMVCFRHQFQQAVENAGIGKLLIHEMRHTMITRLAASGASVPEIQQISGHKTAKMVQRYTHVGLKEAQRTIDRLSNYLGEQNA